MDSMTCCVNFKKMYKIDTFDNIHKMKHLSYYLTFFTYNTCCFALKQQQNHDRKQYQPSNPANLVLKCGYEDPCREYKDICAYEGWTKLFCVEPVTILNSTSYGHWLRGIVPFITFVVGLAKAKEIYLVAKGKYSLIMGKLSQTWMLQWLCFIVDADGGCADHVAKATFGNFWFSSCQQDQKLERLSVTHQFRAVISALKATRSCSRSFSGGLGDDDESLSIVFVSWNFDFCVYDC